MGLDNGQTVVTIEAGGANDAGDIVVTIDAAGDMVDGCIEIMIDAEPTEQDYEAGEEIIDGEEGGDEDEGPPEVWSLVVPNGQWNGHWASPLWNNRAGNFDGASSVDIAWAGYPAAVGATKIKVVGISGLNGYWRDTSGLFIGSVWVKSRVDAKRMGSGSLYPASGPAIAEWASSEVIISIDDTGEYALGYYSAVAPDVYGIAYYVYVNKAIS